MWLPISIAAAVYASKGDYDRAIKEYDEAIRLDPKDARAYYNRGSCLRQQGR